MCGAQSLSHCGARRNCPRLRRLSMMRGQGPAKRAETEPKGRRVLRKRKTAIPKAGRVGGVLSVCLAAESKCARCLARHLDRCYLLWLPGGLPGLHIAWRATWNAHCLACHLECMLPGVPPGMHVAWRATWTAHCLACYLECTLLGVPPGMHVA